MRNTCNYPTPKTRRHCFQKINCGTFLFSTGRAQQRGALQYWQDEITRMANEFNLLNSSPVTVPKRQHHFFSSDKSRKKSPSDCDKELYLLSAYTWFGRFTKRQWPGRIQSIKEKEKRGEMTSRAPCKPQQGHSRAWLQLLPMPPHQPDPPASPGPDLAMIDPNPQRGAWCWDQGCPSAPYLPVLGLKELGPWHSGLWTRTHIFLTTEGPMLVSCGSSAGCAICELKSAQQPPQVEENEAQVWLKSTSCLFSNWLPATFLIILHSFFKNSTKHQHDINLWNA